MTSINLDIEACIRACFESPEDAEVLGRFDTVFRPNILAILAAMYPHHGGLVEDAYHSAFVKYIGLFSKGAKPGQLYAGYFVAIAKNCLIDEIRRRSRDVPIDEVFDGEMRTSLSTDVERIDARVIVLHAMAQLKRRCQFVLESYYIRGMRVKELASRLRIQPDSVHMAIKRCRDELRNILRGR